MTEAERKKNILNGLRPGGPRPRRRCSEDLSWGTSAPRPPGSRSRTCVGTHALPHQPGSAPCGLAEGAVGVAGAGARPNVLLASGVSTVSKRRLSFQPSDAAAGLLLEAEASWYRQGS